MRPYHRERLFEERDGYVIIVPQNAPAVIPLACPVCKVTMRSRDDEVAWDLFNCCHDCELKWAAARREEWKNGWRPSAEEVTSAVAERPQLVFSLNVE